MKLLTSKVSMLTASPGPEYMFSQSSSTLLCTANKLTALSVATITDVLAVTLFVGSVSYILHL